MMRREKRNETGGQRGESERANVRASERASESSVWCERKCVGEHAHDASVENDYSRRRRRRGLHAPGLTRLPSHPNTGGGSKHAATHTHTHTHTHTVFDSSQIAGPCTGQGQVRSALGTCHALPAVHFSFCRFCDAADRIFLQKTTPPSLIYLIRLMTCSRGM